MGGNRTHGYRRGNAAGRNGGNRPSDWWCAGCERFHGGRVSRTLYRGYDYCDRKYLALKTLAQWTTDDQS